MGHQSFFETEKSPQTRMNTKKNVPDSKIRHIIWWERVDSDHRSETQQIYSLPPLATRAPLHSRRTQILTSLFWLVKSTAKIFTSFDRFHQLG